MTSYTVYLAGPINYDSAPNRWREDIIRANNKNNLEFINPLDLEVDLDNDAEIVDADLEAIENSDAVLARWKSGIETAGTPMEMFFAHGAGVPVVTWYEGRVEDLGPWVRHHSDSIVASGSQATNELLRVI